LSNLTKGLVLVAVILAIGAGLVVWKQKVAGHSQQPLNRISKAEIELLLANAGKVNPMLLKRLAENPDLKKQQIENLKQLLALAGQAQKDGITNKPYIQQELKNIRAELIATSYDKEINKDKGPMPPFGFITEDQTKAFWGEGAGEKNWWANLKDKIGFGTPDPEAEFQAFLDAKITLLKEGNPQMKDREITEEEKTQARDFFAKIRIYEKEALAEAGKSRDTEEEKAKWKNFKETSELQVKLQQAQFLAGLASKGLTDKMKVTDEDIAKYISEHPELDTKEKRAKAEEILNRAKGGEDFAVLANQFSEDPGNKDAKGVPQGGLYKDVTKGKMVAPFEAAALALEPGQVSPELVETDFGYHIIKLEKKGEGKGPDGKPAETYDVRHILISNNVSDPENPTGRPQPVKEMVRAKLESEREKTIMDEIEKNNPVEVPEDFDIPPVSDEQIQQMMQKQQQGPMMMPPDAGGPEGGPETGKKPDAKKPAPAKPEAKKK
jgi:parvulin-like peptidyl-prolyl isomerase